MNKHLPKILLISGFTGVFFIARTNQSGPGSGYTNAPSESSCATSGCHGTGSPVTSGTNWNRLSLRDNFTGSGYIPDSTYELVLTYKESGMLKSGFQITCLNSSNAKAGTFATLDGRTQVYTASNRSYLGHTLTGSSTINTDTTSYRIKWTAPATNMGTVTFYATLNKANGNSQSSGDVIYAKTFKVSPSNLLPTADVKIIENKYCTGSALTFDATTTGSPTSYAWKFPGTGVSPSTSTAQNPKVTYSNSGTYKAILTVTNSKGQGSPDTLTFSVLSSPSASITPNTTQNICSGDSVQLSGNSITNATYLWSPTNQTGRVIYAKDSGNYTVTVTAVNGCSRTSAAVKVIQNPSPVISAIKSFSGDTVCEGAPFNIGAFVVSGTADSFSFTSVSGPYVDSTTYPDVINSGSKTYNIWGKSPLGCVSAPASITIHSKAPEAAPVLSSSNIDYTGFRVNWSAVGNATGYLVSVDSGKTFITPSSGSTGLYHDVTGLLGNHSMNVLVYATTNGLCNKTATGNITVTTLSCTPIDFSVSTADNRVCKNSAATIVLHNLAGKNIGIKIDGVAVGSDTIQQVTVTDTRNYQVSVIDSSAMICGYTNQQILLVEDSIGTPVLSPSGTAMICSNNSTVPFTATVVQGSHIDSVFFYKNNNLESKGKALSHQFSVNNGDTIMAIAQNVSGCKSIPSQKTLIQINPIPNAAFGISNLQFDYTFTATDTQGTHKWKAGTDSITGFSAQFDLTAFKNDSVTVTHTITKNGCTSSQSQKIFVPDFAGVRSAVLLGVQLYPNPASDLLTVHLPDHSDGAVMDVRNPAGQLMLSARLKSGNNIIYTDVLAPGSYVFAIKSNHKETTGSLIIVR